MKKNIWIINHYAKGSFYNKGGRHYWFSKFLKNYGYIPTVFCADDKKNFDKTYYKEDTVDGIKYIFIKSSSAAGTRKDIKRIFSMLLFYKNIVKYSKKKIGLIKPDVLLASSVHPLAILAGIKIKKRFNVPLISEIRDLWPESIIAYRNISKKSLIAKILYMGEKYLYKKSDKIIFTMEGGKDYIIKRKWDSGQGGPIYLDKVYHINNGLDLEQFKYDAVNEVVFEKELNTNDFKVIYTGSIREANNVEKILITAKEIQQLNEDIKFYIFGSGYQLESLKNYAHQNKLDNVIFFGHVEKKYIPYILSKSDLNILTFRQSTLKEFGASLNKLFGYFASGKPIITDCEFGYDLVKRYSAGIVCDNATPKDMANSIIYFKNVDKNQYNIYCENARKAAIDFDFSKLTIKLIKIIEE